MTDQPVDPTTARSMATAAENANLPQTSGDYAPRTETLEDVPDKAEDVVTWIQDAADPTQATARADLAEQAENSRTGGPRISVQNAIDAVRDQ
jgi:hypothetical protein